MHKSAISIIFVSLLILISSLSAVFADGSRLVVGDIINVVVDGEQDFTKPYQINRDGCIVLPMIKQPVKILGINTTDAAGIITNALKEVFVNPQVTVQFVERAKMRVFVVGQVKATGLQEVGVGDRVIQALAQAGYDDTANLSAISIRRDEKVIPVDLNKYLSGEDVTVNVELESNDTIIVPRQDTVGDISVLGKVAKSGVVPIKSRMTFRDLMGMIGGVTVDADTANITIKRENVADPIKIDYAKAMAGDAVADVILMPNDIINIPEIEKSFFTIMGGVRNPGQFPVKGSLTVSEAIGLAGGVIPNVGDMTKVQIMFASGPDAKAGDTKTLNMNNILAKSLPEPLVKRGDVINVPIHKEKPSGLQILQSLSPLFWLLL